MNIKIVKSTTLMLVLLLVSCYKVKVPTNLKFANKLSDYKIYAGNASNITPNADFHIFEVSAQLFSNHAKKQRLVKIPSGSKITNSTNELPEFPEGTILVKTFYYWNDERDTSLGKKIIETRLLIKEDNLWNVAGYEWNEAQTDAVLKAEGITKSISWINGKGKEQLVAYEIPNSENCAICHQVNENVKPIGPNLKYLNFDVKRNGSSINQIQHLINLGLLSSTDHNSISFIPDYNNTSLSDEIRARAYLDANCGYCHKPGGYVPAANRVTILLLKQK